MDNEDHPLLVQDDQHSFQNGTDDGQRPGGKISSKRIDRSCLMCYQRKIRCNKKIPSCSNCERSDLICCYPGPTTVRKQKTSINEVLARVARLERTVTALSNNNHSGSVTGSDSPKPAPTASGPNVETADTPSPASELLVQDGKSSRYVNETLLSRILEEEQDIMATMGAVRNEPRTESDIGPILSYFNKSLEIPNEFYPSHRQATQLWQAYLNNVNPLSKLLHIPSMQPLLFAAISHSSDPQDDLAALLFAIYFAATTSMTSADAAHLLGRPKNVSLEIFKQGIEVHLARANILDTPNLKSLQALAIYIMCLRVYEKGRGSWSLNGLAIRIAQSMGLHIDGETLNLSPFESELRRRLWWYLCSLDGRASEDHGIELILPEMHDTKKIGLPLNVDDSELSPDMKVLPTEGSKWSEMGFTLMMIEINRARHLFRRDPVDFDHNERIIDSLMTRLEERHLRYCDTNIPVQRATDMLARLILSKMRFYNHQRFDRISSEIRMKFTAGTLQVACQVLELDLKIHSDDILEGFNWGLRTYDQYHLLTYILWHLCQIPDEQGAEHAWSLVESAFARSSQLGPKWRVLQLLKEKAIRIREADKSQNLEQSSTDNFDMLQFLNSNAGSLPDLSFVDGHGWTPAANLNFGHGFDEFDTIAPNDL